MLFIFAYITLPILCVVVASVSPITGIALDPATWRLDWYGELWSDEWFEPFYLSFWIAILVSCMSGILGTLGAYVVVYKKVPGHNTIMSFLLSPLAVPQIVKGVAIVLFFSSIGFYNALGTPGLIAGHTILTIPFSLRMIATAMYNFDRNLDRAARILGASQWQRIRYVLLPLIKPGIFSGMTLSFILSFNNISISLFLVRPGEMTLPIAVINYMEYSIDPLLAAVNVASLLCVLAVIYIFERLGGFDVEFHGGSK
jgi:putative spermidine/putrescine transport system permease protein